MAERKNSKRNGRPTATKTNGNGNGTHAALAAAVVDDITRSNTTLAKASIASVAPQIAPEMVFASGAANAQANESSVTDEAEGTAVAFGAFVKNIGMAVAAAQEELDKTLRETAKQLSETKSEVVHTFEQELDDDGHLTNNGNAKMQALPLINYLMPTAYQWSRVYLEADMKVQEFNSKSGFDIQSKSSNTGFGLRGGVGAGSGWNLGGGFGYGSNSNQTSVQSGYSMDNAAGSMHMEATLEPRSDIELPKPIILQKGPVMTLVTLEVKDITVPGTPTADNPNPPAKVVGKEANLKATVKTAQGAPNKNKLLEYSVDQPKINHRAVNGLTTNNDGEITLNLKREGAAYDPNTAMPVQVIVWLGLVSKTITVNM